jgi:hypothetical protein
MLFSTWRLILAPSKINAAEAQDKSLAFLSLKCQVLVAVEVLLASSHFFFGTNKTVYRLILLLLIYFAPQHYKLQDLLIPLMKQQYDWLEQ